METACASISIDLLSYYDLFDTTIALRMMSASFMAIGFVIIVAFIDDKKCVLVSQARCLSDYVYGRHHSACAYLCHYPVDGGVVEHFRCEKRFFPLFSCWFRK